MHVWSIAFVALLLIGCDGDRLTAQEMRIAIDECRDYELRPVLLHDGFGNQRIECRPYADES
jgi:hypothetical protein